MAGGKVFLSAGIARLPKEELERLVLKVRRFEDFEDGDDPYGEHDFGAIDHDGQTVFWKIDYYDAAPSAGNPDPSAPANVARVLTIMLAEEY